MEKSSFGARRSLFARFLSVVLFLFTIYIYVIVIHIHAFIYVDARGALPHSSQAGLQSEEWPERKLQQLEASAVSGFAAMADVPERRVTVRFLAGPEAP